MKKVILLLGTMMGSEALAENCFMAQENGNVLQSEGDPDKRYAPMSTFKIPLSLMGFDSGLLVNEMHPVWHFKEGYVKWRDAWKQDQTPQSWMKESCVWYSQVLTQKLGMKKFQAYVTKFDYGNQDLTGDKGQNNGLMKAWLSSSLQISSAEQVAFLQRMLGGTLPIKPHAVAMTKNILFVEDLKNGWKFFGKTGAGPLLNADGTKNSHVSHGWFIGWIEKGDRCIVFSNHREDAKEGMGAGQRAKADAKERLTKMIDQMEANP